MSALRRVVVSRRRWCVLSSSSVGSPCAFMPWDSSQGSVGECVGVKAESGESSGWGGDLLGPVVAPSVSGVGRGKRKCVEQSPDGPGSRDRSRVRRQQHV